jgi:glycerate 2-kinase
VKETALRVFRETLAAINIHAALERKLDCDGKSIRVEGRTVKLAEFSEFVAIAVGKAAFPMAEALVNVLPSDRSPEGILVAPAAPARTLPRWKTFIGGHPIPAEASFIAGRAILERLARSRFLPRVWRRLGAG